MDILPTGPDAAAKGQSAPMRRQRRRRLREQEFLCPFCEAVILDSDLQCSSCRKSLTYSDLYEEEKRLQKQRAQFQILSFGFGLPGLGLTIIALVMAALAAQPGPRQNIVSPVVGLVLLFGGFLLLGTGIVFATLYKRFHAAWALLALLYWLGFLILMILPDQKYRRLYRIRTILKWR